jgi:hypothetical protein
MELACAFGADLIFLNDYDTTAPRLAGLPGGEGPGALRQLKRLTGRMLGIDVYVKDAALAAANPDAWPPAGALVNEANLERAIEQGADFVNVTGDPLLGAENESILRAIEAIPARLKDRLVIVSGRMNKAGVPGWSAERLLPESYIRDIVNAGVNIVMMPAPGSTPGFTVERVTRLVELSHELGALTLTGIGTSQEGADEATIRAMALNCKMCGTDMHHLGDSGLVAGVASPENILAYAIVIKGRRHAYRRMAMSINR